MTKVCVDFSPALHGQFLEFVLNKYVFKLPIDVDLFFNCGGAHAKNLNQNYLAARTVESGHYSSLDGIYSNNPSKVVYVKYNPNFGFIAAVNRLLRCHKDTNVVDLDTDFIENYHHDLIFEHHGKTGVKVIRNDVYTKILENHQFAEEDASELTTKFPKYYFDYGAFFDFPTFLKELDGVAAYLDQMLFYDSSLHTLWTDFISRNQGYNLMVRGNYLLSKIFANEPETIDDNVYIQAWINCVLSKTVRLFTGPLFDQESYPTSTQEIYAMIKENINNIDKLY